MSFATLTLDIATPNSRPTGSVVSRHSGVEWLPRVVVAILAVCLLVPASARAAGEGVQVYLQPLSSDASRLTFTIGSLSAVNLNGAEIPLAVNLRVVTRAESSRQRLLASGRLPTGGYVGFVVSIRQAALRGERGLTALVVPDAPVRIDFPFTVGQRQVPLVWLTLDYQRSAVSGFDFNPVFLSVTPPKPIAEHAGFVTNSRSNTITVFDRTLTQAVAAIETCAGPAGMALDQIRRRLYVACSSDDEIQWIDVATSEIVERTRVSPGDRPRELALTPDGMTLLAVNTGSNSVSMFDASSLARQERIAVGSGPTSIAIDSTGRRAFVFNTLSSSVSVIDIASRTTAATLSTDSSPLRGQFNRRGDRLYVIYDRSPYMTVIDPQRLTTIAKARLRTGVTALAVDSVRDLVCIAGGNEPTLDFYDPNALMPIYSMQARAGVSYMRIDAEHNVLYMVDPDSRSVLVARLADRKVFSEIDVGSGPYWVSVMGER